MNTKHISRRNCIAGNSERINRNENKSDITGEKNIFAEFKKNTRKLLLSMRTIRLPEFSERKKQHLYTYRPKHKSKKELFAILRNVFSRTLSASLGLALTLFFLSVVFSAYFMPCYEFTVEGKHICYSAEITAYADALQEVNRIITENVGESEAIDKSAESSVKIIRRADLTPADSIKNNVSALSSAMVEAEVMYSDGAVVTGFKSSAEMQSAIDEYIKSISEENSQIKILSNITSEKKYIPVSRLAGENTNSILGGKGGIRVQTVTEKSYTEEIPYTAETLTDDTVYTGTSEVVTKGENGVRSVVAEVTAENGIEISRNILSDTITKAPTAEVIRIGTKRIPTGVGSGTFLFPAKGTISSRFGVRWNRQHKGLDIANDTGTDIIASDEGIVTYSGVMNGYGNIIIIDHKNGYKTYYAHCNELFAQKGEIVEKGEVIAAMGSTGNSTGPHLHFEVREGNTPLDPENFVKK